MVYDNANDKADGSALAGDPSLGWLSATAASDTAAERRGGSPATAARPDSSVPPELAAWQPVQRQGGQSEPERGRNTGAGTAFDREFPATPAPRPSPAQRTAVRRRWAARLIGATVAIVLSIGGTAAIMLGGRGDDIAVPAIATAAPSPVPLSPACAGLRGSTISDGAGGSSSPEGAVAAFESGYYTRDTAKVLAVLSPDTPLDRGALAVAVPAVPPGARHCVALTPTATALSFAVDIAVIYLDGKRHFYPQTITVREITPGKFGVHSVRERPSQ